MVNVIKHIQPNILHSLTFLPCWKNFKVSSVSFPGERGLHLAAGVGAQPAARHAGGAVRVRGPRRGAAGPAAGPPARPRPRPRGGRLPAAHGRGALRGSVAPVHGAMRLIPC